MGYYTIHTIGLDCGFCTSYIERHLLDNERGFAVSVGLLNAKKWRKLAELSERLGRLIEDIEVARKKVASGEFGKIK